VPIVGAGISGLAAPILSGKNLASKRYSHLDNHDFGGCAKRQRPASPPPNSMPTRTASAGSSTPKHLAADQFVEQSMNSCLRDDRAVHAIAGTARAGAIVQIPEVKIDDLPGLASDEKNSEAVAVKFSFIWRIFNVVALVRKELRRKAS
jgi:hypothetical protein